MNRNQQDFAKLMQDLAIHSGTEWLRGAQRYSAFWQRIASGELDQQQLSEETIRYARDETDRFIRNLTTLSRDYYNALIELGRLYNPPFFEQVVTRAQPAGQPGPAAAGRPRTQIELRGSIGQDAIQSFVMTNEQDEPDEVSFAVSEFSAPGGQAAFRPPLSILPPHFTLTRHNPRSVMLKLPLLKDLFVPGQHYTATISAQSRNPFEISLDVVATAAATQADSANL